jgi:hypothetical protein
MEHGFCAEWFDLGHEWQFSKIMKDMGDMGRFPIWVCPDLQLRLPSPIF